MITVHRFRVFDRDLGDWTVELSKAPDEVIRSLNGRIIPGTAEKVERSAIADDGRYRPSRGNFEVS